MPTQKVQKTPLPPLTVLSLAKYSYATVSAEHNAPLPWTHVSERDMYAVFAAVRTQISDSIEETERFRIARDAHGSVVEDIDLLRLSAQARVGVEQSKTSSADQSPDVHVIVRPPTMAMRFPLANGQIHRFQIRFSKDTDYYTALSKFAAANCPLSEAGSSSPIRGLPRPASAITSQSNHAQHGSAHGNEKPASTIPQYGSGVQPNMPSFSETRWSLHRPTPVISNNRQAPTPRFQCQELGQNVSQGEYNITTDHQTLPRQPLAENVEEYDSHPPSSAPSRLGCYDHSAGLANSTQQRKLQDIIYQPQPSTAPVYRSQTDLLPPMRELPFIRPKSGFSPSKIFEDAPNGSQIIFPVAPAKEALPRAKGKAELVNGDGNLMNEISTTKSLEKKPSSRAPKKPASRGKKTPAKEPEKSVPSVEELLQRDNFVLPASTSSTLPAQKETIANEPPSRRTRQQKKKAKAVTTRNPPPAPSPTQSNDHSAKRISTTNDPSISEIVPDSQEPLPRKPLSDRSPNPTTAALSTALLNDPLFKTSPEFASYADLPVEERRSALEAFMCEQLENPAFRALCVDMRGMWQAVVFGREVGVEKEW